MHTTFSLDTLFFHGILIWIEVVVVVVLFSRNVTINVSLQVINFVLSDPNTKVKLTISGLANPLQLKFSVGDPPSGKQAACKYFNETLRIWMSDGLEAVGPVNGTLTCKSTHATVFAPSNDIRNASNATTTLPPTTTVEGET